MRLKTKKNQNKVMWDSPLYAVNTFVNKEAALGQWLKEYSQAGNDI